MERNFCPGNIHPDRYRIASAQKGAISVYGMGRFPVTLYADQWRRIDQELITSGQLDDFIENNKSSLTFKG